MLVQVLQSDQRIIIPDAPTPEDIRAAQIAASQIDIGMIVQFIVIAMLAFAMYKMFAGSWRDVNFGNIKQKISSSTQPKPKPIMPAVSSSTYESKKNQLLEARRLDMEAKGRQYAAENGVEFMRLDRDWAFATTYWFRDAQGRDIMARSSQDLADKLEILTHKY